MCTWELMYSSPTWICSSLCKQKSLKTCWTNIWNEVVCTPSIRVVRSTKRHWQGRESDSMNPGKFGPKNHWFWSSGFLGTNSVVVKPSKKNLWNLEMIKAAVLGWRKAFRTSWYFSGRFHKISHGLMSRIYQQYSTSIVKVHFLKSASSALHNLCCPPHITYVHLITIITIHDVYPPTPLFCMRGSCLESSYTL